MKGLNNTVQKLMYSEEFEWSKGFLPAQKMIAMDWLGSARYATFFEDTRQATDLVIICINDINVALRIRKYKFIKYRKQTTMRFDFPDMPNIKTEYQKYLNGYCDYLLICFATPSNDSRQGILCAVCWDLSVFREAINRYGLSVKLLTKRRLKAENKKVQDQEIYANKNLDDSRLIVYDRTDFAIAENLINKPIIHASYNLHQLTKPAITAIMKDDLNAPPQIALPFDRDDNTRLHMATPPHDRCQPSRRTG